MNESRVETYLVSNVGTCLLLKLCGFVEESRAEILDVSEHHLRLGVGVPLWRRWLGGGKSGDPMDVEIRLTSAEPADARRPMTFVEVVVRDRTFFANSHRFESAARRLLWQLRGYLMVQ